MTPRSGYKAQLKVAHPYRSAFPQRYFVSAKLREQERPGIIRTNDAAKKMGAGITCVREIFSNQTKYTLSLYGMYHDRFLK
jgi:hypothetical protein